MKLTKNQKEVIKLMREGKILQHSRFIGYSTDSFSETTKFINKNTTSSLDKRGLIQFDKSISRQTYTYKLTELGKTIIL